MDHRCDPRPPADLVRHQLLGGLLSIEPVRRIVTDNPLNHLFRRVYPQLIWLKSAMLTLDNRSLKRKAQGTVAEMLKALKYPRIR